MEDNLPNNSDSAQESPNNQENEAENSSQDKSIPKEQLKEQKLNSIASIIKSKITEIKDKYAFSRVFYINVFNIAVCVSESFKTHFEQISKSHSELFTFAKQIQQNLQNTVKDLKNQAKMPKNPILNKIKTNLDGCSVAVSAEIQSFSLTLDGFINDSALNHKINEILTAKNKIFKENSAELVKIETLLKSFKQKDPGEILEQFNKNIENTPKLESLIEKYDLLEMEVRLLNYTNQFISGLNFCLKTILGNSKEYQVILKRYFTLVNQIDKEFKLKLESIYKNISFKSSALVSQEEIKDSLHPETLLTNKEDINSFFSRITNLSKESPNISAVFKGEVKVKDFNSIDAIIEKLLEALPQEYDYTKSSLFKEIFAAKYDPGMFSSWTECTVLLSSQGNLLVFSQDLTERLVKMPCKKVKIIQYDALKHPNRIELNCSSNSFFSSDTKIYLEMVNLEDRDCLMCLLQVQSIF